MATTTRHLQDRCPSRPPNPENIRKRAAAKAKTKNRRNPPQVRPPSPARRQRESESEEEEMFYQIKGKIQKKLWRVCKFVTCADDRMKVAQKCTTLKTRGFRVFKYIL